MYLSALLRHNKLTTQFWQILKIHKQIPRPKDLSVQVDSNFIEMPVVQPYHTKKNEKFEMTVSRFGYKTSENGMR